MRKTCPPTLRFATARSRSTPRRWAFIPRRDRLCLVQLSDGRGDEHLVRFSQGKRILRAEPEGAARRSEPAEALSFRAIRCGDDPGLSRVHGRAALLHPHRVAPGAHLHRPPRPQGSRHASCSARRFRKQQQTSDWGAPELNDAQREYAASDVRYLHALKEKLDERLVREGSVDLAQACFDFLPAPRPARPRRLARAGHFRTRRLMTDLTNV